MKLLLDAHIGRLIATWLNDGGHDLLRAIDLPPRTSDEEILRIAAREDRVVMTSDKGFGHLVFRLEQASAGVILLRIDVPSERERFEIIKKFRGIIEASAPGHFVVVTRRGAPFASSGVRMRPMAATMFRDVRALHSD